MAQLSPERMRVMTLNIQLDAMYGKNIDGIVDIVKASRADVVGMQEVGDNGPVIAKKLGFNYVKVGDDTAVISRYALTPPKPGKRIVTVTTPRGNSAQVLDLHLAYKPYQPYQLLKIPYEGQPFLFTALAAIEAAWATRGKDVMRAITELKEDRQSGVPGIVMGDYNQPSHLDWTARAAAIGRHPMAVEWPETKAFANAGYNDAYRKVYPDEIAHPGNTWTPLTKPDDPNDHHDRLDHIEIDDQITPVSAEVVGENLQNADIAVENYATDHRGVVVELEFKPRPSVLRLPSK